MRPSLPGNGEDLSRRSASTMSRRVISEILCFRESDSSGILASIPRAVKRTKEAVTRSGDARTYKFFNFAKLAIADGATTVVRVAMVCNDLAIANSSLGHFKGLSADAVSHIRQKGMPYFVRMSCGHLREGIKTIQEIKANAALVTRCYSDAQSAFVELCECLPAGEYVPSFNATCHRFATRPHFTTTQTKSLRRWSFEGSITQIVRA
jgi:hypothetical protein